MPMKFRFRWIPLVAALTAAAVGIALGQWQTRRAAEKEAIEARQQARESAPTLLLGAQAGTADEMEFRRVKLKGSFLPDWTVYLDNRPYKSAAGFHVLTPMRLAGSETHVLVARGWVRRDVTDRTRLPSLPAPPGEVEIEGVARKAPGQVLQLGTAAPLRPGAILQNVDAAAFAQASGLPTLPFIVEQATEVKDGLVRDWPRPSSGVDKHRGYAFQWYALAATALLFFFATGLRRGTS